MQSTGTTLVAGASSEPLANHHTFYHTGKKQSFIVPAGVTSISVIARGAAGAGTGNVARGGRVSAVIPVTPGETLYVFVGGKGSANTGAQAFNGGAPGGAYPYCQGGYCYGYGGGGASDVRQGGDSLTDRIVVAGGGGGNGTCGAIGGGGCGRGGRRGGTGGYCYSSHFYSGGGGGAGGTQKKGGSGGAGQIGSYGNGGSGDSGAFGNGGNGGTGGYESYCHGYCDRGGAGGGGGGGYYGGGGGGGGNAGLTDQYVGGVGGGGGGGSGYAEPTATNVHMSQDWRDSGNGRVVFSW